MRKIKEAFRLRFLEKRSFEEIARNLNIGETTAREYIFRAQRVGINWPLPNDMDEEALEKVLYPSKDTKENPAIPDFAMVHKELKKKGVTLTLLWREYQDIHGEKGYGYSQYCNLYNDWRSQSDVWMPQEHKAAEATFIDYAGLTIPIFDQQTSESYEAQIFVAVLGASTYTYAEATKTQTLEDWISSNRRMFTFFQGVTELQIPDNLKTGVKKSDLYEPEINLTYQEMAQHYGTIVLPARVRKPKDKSKVENGVQNVERQILAPLRNQKFFSLSELNNAIQESLQKMNLAPFQKMPEHSRYSLYLELEKPALKPLPINPYELSRWKKTTIDGSYHVNVEGCHYSVPYTFNKKSVEIRYNERIVEVFYKSKQIAIHAKSDKLYNTNNQHRPKNHQLQAECNPEKIRENAKKIGENALAWVEEVLKDETFHLRQREKKCLGMLQLAKTFILSRLDAACKRSLFYKNFSYKSIQAILEKNLDQIALPCNQKIISLPQDHDNIRDYNYYDQNKGV
ncbi:MAG: IS21 family transposase [Chlamydiae bacterium]|nr:IS21 family transposase [Chlamydiota bacterium]